jgi:F-type H+-transporting ATPase subunit delta
MAKAEGTVARRYARALFELCPPALWEQMRDAIREVASVWQNDKQLRMAINNPAIALAQRMHVLADIAERVSKGDQTLKNFLMLLLENGRVATLPRVAEVFSGMIDEVRKLLSLEIISAFELPDPEKTNVQEQIKAEYGALATIAWKVDRQILGGLLIKTGDRLLDSSVRGSLEKMRVLLMAQ